MTVFVELRVVVSVGFDKFGESSETVVQCYMSYFENRGWILAIHNMESSTIINNDSINNNLNTNCGQCDYTSKFRNEDEVFDRI